MMSKFVIVVTVLMVMKFAVVLAHSEEFTDAKGSGKRN